MSADNNQTINGFSRSQEKIEKAEFFYVIHTVQILVINTSTNSCTQKIHLEKGIKLLHVSAPGCHHQAVIQNKEVTRPTANLGIVSAFLI